MGERNFKEKSEQQGYSYYWHQENKRIKQRIDAIWHKYNFNANDFILNCSEEIFKQENNGFEDFDIIKYFNEYCIKNTIPNLENNKHYKELLIDLFTVSTERAHFINALRFNIDTSLDDETDTDREFDTNIIFKYLKDDNIFVDIKTSYITGKRIKARIEGIHYKEYIIVNINYYNDKLINYHDAHMVAIDLKNKEIIYLLNTDDKNKFRESYDCKPTIEIDYHGKNLPGREIYDLYSLYNRKGQVASRGSQSAEVLLFGIMIALSDYDTCIKNRNLKVTDKTATQIHKRSSIVDINENDQLVYLPISTLSYRELIKYKNKPIGTHSSPHPHHVNGHERHYKNGKVIWINSYNKKCPNYKGKVSGTDFIIYDNNK